MPHDKYMFQIGDPFLYTTLTMKSGSSFQLSIQGYFSDNPSIFNDCPVSLYYIQSVADIDVPS